MAALAIGALVGIERGWKQRGENPGSRTADLRTFTLAGLLGGIAAIVGADIGGAAFAALAIAFSALFGVFQWREALADDQYSATSTVAGLLTFALGALAGLGQLQDADGRRRGRLHPRLQGWPACLAEGPYMA